MQLHHEQPWQVSCPVACCRCYAVPHLLCCSRILPVMGQAVLWCMSSTHGHDQQHRLSTSLAS